MLEHLFNKGRRFSSASQAEDYETLLTEDKDAEELQQPNNSGKSVPKLFLSLLWFLSLAVAVFTGVWIGSRYFADVDRLCTKHISQYCTKHPVKNGHGRG
jgi:hypothetical protein